jgi:hypothetical protein
MRESSCNFAGVLHNGEHIIGTGRQTSLVPAGRGPFDTWEEAAIDALGEPPHNMRLIKAWTSERVCYEAEKYNGFGYRGRGPSPYVWSGTTVYSRGKYVADGVYDSQHRDAQLGVWPMYIRALDLAGEASLRRRSSKLQLLAKVRSLVKWLGTTVTGFFSLENLTGVKEWLGVGQSIFDAKTLVIVLAGVAAVWLLVNVLDSKIVEDHKEGRFEPSGDEPGAEPPKEG